MDYGYKITTHGRAVLAACGDLGKGLKLTRAAVGSGMIDVGEDLAKSHDLIHYVAEATIADRHHEKDRLYLTVQYSNQNHPETGMFILSEFMVWAEDPETGQEIDFLYATLGDFRQQIPAYSSNFPAGVWSYPLVLAISGELQVFITASPGLVTTLDLLDLRTELLRAIMMNEITLPLETSAGEALLTSSGTPIEARYRLERSGSVLAAVETITGQLTAQIEQTAVNSRAYVQVAQQSAVSQARSYTDNQIAAVRQESAAAGSAADSKITAHNTAASAHPASLMVVTK